MANLDLSEIRALLVSSAETERVARKPLIGGLSILKNLVRPQREDPPATAPSLPPPRRVGLKPRTAEAGPAPPERADDLAADDPFIRRRQAFGMRAEVEVEVAVRPAPSLALPAPEAAARAAQSLQAMPAGASFLDEADVGQALRRLGSRTAREPASAIETPYLPEDLADPGDAAVADYFPDADLFDAPAPAVAGAEAAETLLPANDADPEAELLTHLERVFLAEQAALHARSA